MKELIISILIAFVSIQSNVTYKKHEFEVKTEDNFRISAYSVTNKDFAKNRPTILMLHGSGKTGNKELWEERRGTVQDVYDLGYNIVAFDIRGHGKSDPQKEGEFTFPIADVRAIVKWIENNDQFESGKIGAIGSSFGSNILIAGAVLSDINIETIVSFSVTGAAERAINAPEMVRIPKPYKDNTIKSAFYIASENEFHRFNSLEMADTFYNKTDPLRRKKLIVPGKIHASSLYLQDEIKKEVLNWLAKELPIK